LSTKYQSMRRRDEMLGLNEYLAHLTKCFVLAGQRGHRTVGVLFGRAAAGAFIATGLVQDMLAAVPGGDDGCAPSRGA
jgi:malonate decarboxylase gamma subunit